MDDARFNAIAVVPKYKVEFPRTVLGIVPVKLPAVRLVKFAPLTAPKRPDQVPVVTVPVVVRLVEPARGEAPIVLYETVTAVPPLNVEPETAPAPLLLNVNALVVLAVTVVEPPKETEFPLMVIDEFTRPAFGMVVLAVTTPAPLA